MAPSRGQRPPARESLAFSGGTKRLVARRGSRSAASESASVESGPEATRRRSAIESADRSSDITRSQGAEKGVPQAGGTAELPYALGADHWFDGKRMAIPPTSLPEEPLFQHTVR